MSKPAILFFARGYQADFFPALASDRYEAVFATMTEGEKARVERRGQSVAGCFEAEYESLAPAPVPDDYLNTSLVADRFLGRFDHDERMRILGKEIAFWSALLDRYKPVAVVNELVAIEISEVLLIECRRRGIRYLAGMNCVVDRLFYWLPDPMTISGKKLPHVTPGPEAFAAARAYLKELAAKDYRPFYVKNLAARRALKPLAVGTAKLIVWWLRGLRQRFGGRFTYEMYDDEYSKRLSVYFKGLLRKYDRLEDIPASTDIVFYPLHQEPEATLNYMSTFYSNQVATIENILKCLGPNQVLVVKEHPVDKGALLQRKFWEIRKRHSGLYYLPAELHGRQVLERAERVVTLTSTVGWEAAVIGKKVYVLGEIFYDDLRGVASIRDFGDLREKLREPAASQERVDPARAEHFVAEMAEISYRGNPFPCDYLYDRDNIEDVIHAIADAAGIGETAEAPAVRQAAEA
jgi:hypothetical protein